MIYKTTGSFESTYAALKRRTDLGESDSLSSLEKWIGRKSKTSDKRPKSERERERERRCTMTLNAACEDRSCQKELGLSSLWRIAAVGLDDTSQPLTHLHTRVYVCVCVYVYTQQGEFTREGSRLKGYKGNLLSRMVHQGRARQISRPTRVSDSSGSRTIVKIHGT